MVVTDVAPLGLFRQPKGLERDTNGDLYILDQQNFRIRKIEKATNMMSTVAGVGIIVLRRPAVVAPATKTGL